jgi:hypothetical protein
MEPGHVPAEGQENEPHPIIDSAALENEPDRFLLDAILI